MTGIFINPYMQKIWIKQYSLLSIFIVRWSGLIPYDLDIKKFDVKVEKQTKLTKQFIKDALEPAWFS